MTTRRALLGGLVGVGLAAVGGCSAPAGASAGPGSRGSSGGSGTAPSTTGAQVATGVVAASPSASDPVAVRAVVGGRVRVGLVVSLASAPGEGSAWAPGAEGAHVAAHRLARGGADVEVVAANDKGSAEGFAAAVDQLAGQGVVGIVVASAGAHLATALPAATAHGIPLVCCQVVPGALLRDGVWTTAPLAEQLDACLVSAAGRDAVLVDAGGGTPSGLRPARTLRCGAAGPDTRALAKVVADARSVVVTGGVEALAATVVALQSTGFAGRVLLGPQARSPRFTAALVAAGASLGQDLCCPGLPTDDPSALRPGAQGQAVTDFLAGVRDAASSSLVSFFDGTPFPDVAWAADAASHDAVVALVDAAALATSLDPLRVAERLRTLRLGHDDGLVCGDLDLGRTGPGVTGRAPVAADAVRLLHATDQDPGLRPPDPSGTPRLSWFADA